MWELGHKEGWALTNWCFWTVVLEKTLESPLDWKENKPVRPKEINPEYSLEGLMLKLKLQYFGQLIWRTESLEKTLMLRKIEAGGEGDDRMRWLDGITDSMDLSWSKLRGDGKGRGRQAWCAAAQGVSNSQTWLRDWTARWSMQWGSTAGVTECWARRGKLLGYAFTQDSEFVSATQSFFWMIGTSVDGRWGVVKRR